MPQQLTLRVILIAPPAGTDFAIQKGRGSTYETILKQRAQGADLTFEFAVGLKPDAGGTFADFSGPLVQGPSAGRFFYIDIGTYAGQADSCWSRRLKVPLSGIPSEMAHSGAVLIARISGTAKDGGPTCGTAKSPGWRTES